MHYPKVKQRLPFLFSGLCLILLSFYVLINLSTLRLFFKASIAESLLIALLIMLALIIRGVINSIFYRQLDIILPFSEGIGLAILNTLGNLLPVSGGFMAKGIYLKQKYQIHFSKYFSATFSLYILFIAVNGAAGLLCLCFLFSVLGNRALLIFFCGFLIMTSSVVVIWFPFIFEYFPRKFKTFRGNVREGWSILSTKKQLLMIIIILQFTGIVVVGFRLWLVFSLFSIQVSYSGCLIFAAVTVLVSLVNIMPGGIGIREAIIGGVSVILGHSFSLSILAVAFDRIYAIIVTLVVAVLFIQTSKNFCQVSADRKVRMKNT